MGSQAPEKHPNVAGLNYIAPKLWIGNVPLGTTENDIRSLCKSFGGELVDLIIHNKPSQYGQLSGFVRFKTLLEMEMILRSICSGALVINGSALKADWARGNQHS